MGLPPPPSQDPIYSSVCVGITKLISALRIHRGFSPQVTITRTNQQ